MTPSIKFAVVKKGNEWFLKDAAKKKEKTWEPIFSEDRVDPAKLAALLRGFPELWAYKFIEKKGKSLEALGLQDPEYVVSATRPNGGKITLQLGKVSDAKARVVSKPPPPQFGQPPMPPQIVTEEYRYAKLADNDQLFEVKADSLKDIAVTLDALRDPQLARFKTDDVKRLEIRHGKEDLVLVKIKDNDKEKWRFEKPGTEEAETKQVEEVLDKLAGLQARDKEVLDGIDLKTVGLDKPHATIKLTLEEGDKDAKKEKRVIVFQVGVKDKEADKLYVRVEGWPRVNQVSADLKKLVDRPALAYRNRRILDLASADLDKIEIERAGEKFAFAKKDGTWSLTAPVSAEIESAKVKSLADDLAKLEGAELIEDHAKPEALEKTYGLAKPKLTVKLHTKAGAKTLTFGKAREGKSEFYARVDDGPVFTLKKDLHDDLDRSSLTYRSKQLWKLEPDAITQITIQTGDAPYDLKRQGKGWKLGGKIDADIGGFEIDELADDLAQLKAERYETHQAKDPKTYGFDKPALKITISLKEGKPRVLEIGKRVEAGEPSYFAKLEGSDAVFVLSEKTVAPLKREPLDLLDKSLLTVNPRSIERIRYDGSAKFAIEAQKDKWQVIDSPAAPFTAEEDAIDAALKPWRQLRAEKYVAFGPKIDWAQYGLAKPASTITATMKPDEGAKDKKPIEHVIELGKDAGDGKRYARVDKKDGVVLLDADTVENLQRSHLDFVDHRVLKYDLDAVATIQRQMPGADVELAKREDNWQIVKPMMRDADNLTVNDILEKTFRLRAKRIAGYPVKDLALFGLDKPVAVITLQLESGKQVIKVGNLSKDAARKDTDERYAIVNDGPMVVVLPADLSRHLVAPALYFADRNLVSFSSVDRAELTRGQRKAVFSKGDANWQMIEPIKASAEDAALDDLVRSLQRLRADEIVAEKGADLKKYGLDQPFLQWRFKSGDADKLNLVVGAAESDKPGARRYAKLEGKDQVFLLGGKVTAKLLDEYRGRKPWDAFDAAQVEELTISGPDKSFKLHKKDGKWSVAGEPDLKVKTQIVTDTLDAMASLKATSYIADTKADLQLYGLTKPAWRIDVQTPTGKRELLLGRNEGTSKRYYAAVAGGDAVFVIDEADGSRIARQLAAFIEAEKKK